MDYIPVIHQFIDGLLSYPDKVTIEQIPSDNERDVVYLITCAKEDTGRLIGKQGLTADALREVLSIAAKNNNQRIHIKLATKEDEQ